MAAARGQRKWFCRAGDKNIIDSARSGDIGENVIIWFWSLTLRFASFSGDARELLQQSDSAAHRTEAEVGEARGVPQGRGSLRAAEAGEEAAACPEGDRVPSAQAVQARRRGLRASEGYWQGCLWRGKKRREHIVTYDD